MLLCVSFVKMKIINVFHLLIVVIVGYLLHGKNAIISSHERISGVQISQETVTKQGVTVYFRNVVP